MARRLATLLAALLGLAGALRVPLRRKGGHSPRYISFERDRAGFNNIKLQLQSMVAIAAVTGRTLVLPPPARADHLDRPYYELDFFDATRLMRVVDVTLSEVADEDRLIVTQPLAFVDLGELDETKHWLFPQSPSRIQHFECLNMTEHDHAVATHAILHGLVFDHHLEEMASSDLELLNLTRDSSTDNASADAGFDCVHIRRGDFAWFAPEYHLEDADLSAKLKGMLSGRPVLVVSDEHPLLELGTEIKYATDAYVADISAETRLAVDMIMCSRATEFVGSPRSTFTNGILELRNRRARLARTQVATPKLYAGEAATAVQRGDTCWWKVSTFEFEDDQLCGEACLGA